MLCLWLWVYLAGVCASLEITSTDHVWGNGSKSQKKITEICADDGHLGLLQPTGRGQLHYTQTEIRLVFRTHLYPHEQLHWIRNSHQTNRVYSSLTRPFTIFTQIPLYASLISNPTPYTLLPLQHLFGLYMVYLAYIYIFIYECVYCAWTHRVVCACVGLLPPSAMFPQPVIQQLVPTGKLLSWPARHTGLM